MNIFKKYLAMFLAIMMLISVVPVTAFGAEADGEVTEAPEATETVPEATEGSDKVSPLEGLISALAKTEGAEPTDDAAAVADNADVIKVDLKVGESNTITDESGNYEDTYTGEGLDETIANVEVKGTSVPGDATVTPVTVLDKDYSFYIQVSEGVYLSSNLQNTTTPTVADQWCFTAIYGTNVTLKNSEDKYLAVDDGKLVLNGSANYFTAKKIYGSNTYEIKYATSIINITVGVPVMISGSGAVNSTEITFTGVAPGTTTAFVGNTQYNITVTSNERTVDIKLEIGETFTYTDTTGVYTQTGDIKQNPDVNYATMNVAGASNATRTPVTAIESGKRYLIINKNTGELLTNKEVVSYGDYGPRDALNTVPEADTVAPELWTIIESNGKYTATQDGQYLAVAGFVAYMYDTETLLDLSYSPEGQGWKIYDGKTGPDLGHGIGGYYLSDNVGNNYGGNAQGTSDTNNNAAYWDIIEIPYTDVTFTGVAEGTTTAKVGYTTYNIIVVPQEVDDEVENTGTDIWTIDPEIQTQRITDATVENGTYTDDSWNAYETALNATNAKLVNIQQTAYTTQAEANSALAELTELVSALETAKNALVPGKSITVRYWRLGQELLEETISVPADATSYELDAEKEINGTTYALRSTKINMAGNVSEFDIQVFVEFDAASGIIGESDIGSTKVAGRAVKEMTVTAGVTYNLGLADILSDGQTVEWSTSDNNVATVSESGLVTAVAEGTATITATVKDKNGKVINTYETIINVLPAANSTSKRTVAVFIDEVKNSEVTCVLYADAKVYQFELVEGELIYGQFTMGGDSKVSSTGAHFYGKPNDKHALASMSSTNSAGDYFPLHIDRKLVTNNSVYFVNNVSSPVNSIANLLGGGSDINSAVWQGIITVAQGLVDKGYDGALGFTRDYDDGDLNSNLSFVSEPLPTFEKTVDGVLPADGKLVNYQRYVDNMIAAVDESVFFKITVTLQRPTAWQKNKKDGTYILDENGYKKSVVLYTYSQLIDTALEVDSTSGLDAYFYTKELDQKDGDPWDGVVPAKYQVNKMDIAEDMNAGWADDEDVRVLEYYLVYKIQEKDVPKFHITNTAQLNYTYQSAYSSGSMASSADAEAKITVVHSAIDSVVIDFGQKLVYSGLGDEHLKNVYEGNHNDFAEKYHGDAPKYGKVEVAKKNDGTYEVTYTPTSILQEPDIVLLYGDGEDEAGKTAEGKIINAFIVYPATTVYYEEGFMFTDECEILDMNDKQNSNTVWSLDNSVGATAVQKLEKLGEAQKNGNDTIYVSNKKHNYGYDPMYDNNPGLDDTYAAANRMGARTIFEFTGDGIQVFAKCTENSGYVSVEVRDQNNKVIRMSMVNTVVSKGDTNVTEGQTGDMSGLPIVSLVDLKNMPHGKYKVTITKIRDGNELLLDGVRIFNTVKEADPFAIDLEDFPEFYELRDYVLHAIGVENLTDSDYIDDSKTNRDDFLADKIEDMANQVYAGISDDTEAPKEAAVIIDSNNSNYSDKQIQDLLDNGPKNELFIYPSQTLTFKVNTKRVMQIGLKAPRGATNVSITVKDVTEPNESKEVNVDNQFARPTTITSSVDMFYTLVDKPSTEAKDYLVTITNTGSEILSVTLLKICDDPSAAFAALTKEDIEDVLYDIYGVEESPIKILCQPADAEGAYGETVNVTVEAKGENLKYKWYFRNTGAENWSVSSIKTNVYSVEMNKSRAGRELYCEITDANGNTVTTNIAKLIAVPGESLEIVKQPNDSEAKMGERFCVEVIAKGDGLTYKWFYRNKGSENWNKSGVSDNTYDDVMTNARAGREVYCVITDAFGNSVTSDIAVIIALPDVALEITQQPVNSEAKMGERYMVEVIAKGDGLTYQWFFRNKGSDIWNKSSVTDNTYDDVMTSSRAGREVYCIITDACGNSVTTDTVKLILLPDLELQILQQPTDAEAKMGEMFCVEVIAQGDNLSYQWYYRNKGSEEFVKSGVRDNTYDDVMTKARAGREVYCVITDACGNSVTTEIAQIVAIPDETLEILVQPSDGMAKMGEMYMVEVVAKGDGLSYQWYFRNPGAKSFSKSGVKDNTYDDVMTAARAGREVYCVITDCWGNSVTTETVKLIVVDDESQLVNGN